MKGFCIYGFFLTLKILFYREYSQRYMRVSIYEVNVNFSLYIHGKDLEM